MLLFGTGTCNRPRIVIRTRRETAELYTAGKHAVITCRVCVRARASVCVCVSMCVYVCVICVHVCVYAYTYAKVSMKVIKV